MDLQHINLSTAAINSLFTNPEFIETGKVYDDVVRRIFKDNNVIMNKWLRYGKNMGELG